MQKPDSLIFDMDGTLWDAVDVYVESWNIMFKKLNIPRTVRREDVTSMIGKDGKKVIATMMPDFNDQQRTQIYADVNEWRRVLIPQKGGKLYEGVIEGLRSLSQKYPLFILSNCATGIIEKFIDWAKIKEHITDELAYGVNNMPKQHNLKLLMEKHGLKNPVYIGDTAGDAEQSRLAGVPFVFVSYGFGDTDNYDIKFDDFSSLTNYFLKL
ncbi:HAD family hydrolase [Mucilaginibacter segetis]|uniref:phosphoglycolate phosphatase n=1 Tax=Mucilaginibacter segetis TaxID=2793071 RepID=A0A934PQM0_9SPHI|nr:HAD family hydrolase [Mucilaginibacter segetis]MBK0378314.1 HAD family hydrolase [Mucilaginibacter segetis]